MGEVYEVMDPSLGRTVALKTVGNLDPSGVLYLKTEFRRAREVLHPNLVRLYDLTSTDHGTWFTMECVDGGEFVEAVRAGLVPGQVPTGSALEDLRDGLRQLVDGLHALHDAGLVHRDVKPPNVLRDRDGRVVLLDFGIASPTEPLGGDRTHRNTAGTLQFMAPECFQGGAAPPSDLYAFGVLAHEALVGSTPFPTDFGMMVLDKQDPDKVWRPSAVGEGIPADLDDLVAALLHPDPAARPSLDAVRRVLAAGAEARPAVSGLGRAGPALRATDLVDRVPERAFLREAVAAVRKGAATTVAVRGRSGMGKSALVRAFLVEVDDAEQTWVLTGRCHPREHVAYKALDEVVDQLTRYLRTLPVVDAARFIPRHLDALVRLFPVLRRVPAFGMGPPDATRASEQEPAETPDEVRRRGVLALRELLARVADRYTLVVWIDDLHWADADSVAVLADLMSPPDRGAWLTVLTYRAEELASPPIHSLNEGRLAAAIGDTLQTMDVGPLPEDAAEELLHRTAGASLDAEAAQAFTAEAQGSPLFLETLATSWGLGEAWSTASQAKGLTEVLSRRIRPLAARARAVLGVCAIATGSLDAGVALSACGLGPADRPVLDDLVALRLLRSSPGDADIRVAPFHDRIAEVVSGLLDPSEQRAVHEELARALRAQGATADVLLTHFAAAGLVDEAVGLALSAAEIAERKLAFHRAAALYEDMLDRGWNTQEGNLRVRLAEALANAGLGGRAGAAFEDAAAHTEGLTSLQQLSLLRRAAQQYLRAGWLDDGARVLEGVLDAHDVPRRGARNRSLMSAMWRRGCFLVRGSRFTPTPVEALDPAAVERVDALWTAATSFAVVDHHYADAMAAEYLLEALKLGEPSRVVHALGYETCAEGILPGGLFHRRARRLGEEAVALAETTGRPEDRAFAIASLGTVHWAHGDWAGCVRCCDEAVATFRAVGAGVSWSLALNYMYLFASLAQRGDLTRLVPEVERAYQDALARGDRFQEAICLLGQPAIAWLAADRAAWALEAADTCIGRWPDGAVLTQHYHHVVAGTQAALYLGDAEDAWARVDGMWHTLKDAMFLNIEVVRVELSAIRARAAVACLARESTDPEGARVLRQAVSESRAALASSRLPAAEGFVALVDANLASAEGDVDRARRAMRSAAAALRAADVHHVAWAAAHRVGDAAAWPSEVSDHVVDADRFAQVWAAAV